MKKYQKKWYLDNVDYKREYSRQVYRDKILDKMEGVSNGNTR